MRRTKTRSRRYGRRNWIALALLGLTFLALNIALVRTFGPKRYQPPTSQSAEPELHYNTFRSAIDHRSSRPVYPYSIIAGGAYSIPELAESMATDPVVARHYRAFEFAGARMTVAREPMLMYASFRRGGEVYWTKKPVHIPAGEILLTDGSITARARCGNQLSAQPKKPTITQSPTEQEMDQPKVTPGAPKGGMPRQPRTPPSALAFEIFPPDTVSSFPIITRTPGTAFGGPGSSSLGLGPIYYPPGIAPFPLTPIATVPPVTPPFVLSNAPPIATLPVSSLPIYSASPMPIPPVSPTTGAPALPSLPGTPVGPLPVPPLSSTVPPGLPTSGFPPLTTPPSTPGSPGSPSTPEGPGSPGPPGTPGSPQIPNTPNTPGTPETPTPPDTPAPVPEPEAVVLLAAGIAGLVLLRWRVPA